jgi:hypothetical protein
VLGSAHVLACSATVFNLVLLETTPIRYLGLFTRVFDYIALESLVLSAQKYRFDLF